MTTVTSLLAAPPATVSAGPKSSHVRSDLTL